MRADGLARGCTCWAGTGSAGGRAGTDSAWVGPVRAVQEVGGGMGSAAVAWQSDYIIRRLILITVHWNLLSKV